jgi:O-antigen ligase
VATGLLAQLGLLCLLARPLRPVWLNRAAWLLGLGVLVLAQSKTAWLAFILCSALILAYRVGPRLGRQLADVQQPTGILMVLGLLLLALAALLAALVLGDGLWIERLLHTPEGQQLQSLTGRDRIWAIAWEEWQAHRTFGWGPQIWGEAYRQSIGLANATHAHNQLMDTLSRSGLVGATALVLYSLVLCALSWRLARKTQGLSLALLLALLLRGGSEVPLLLMGYGPDLIAHLLLLMVLATPTVRAARSAPQAAQAQMPAGLGGHRA